MSRIGLVLALFCLAGLVAAEDPLLQVSESFDENPGWEALNNRIHCEECPTVVQDFGWNPTTHASQTPGEIGGKMWQSTTPAHYGLPFGRPLSFQDPMSATGTIAVMPQDVEGVGYLGFFNQARQEWRPWSSLALRIKHPGRDDKAWFIVDYMNSEWGAGGFETDIAIPADGSVHRWSFEYDPEAIPPATWPDPNLRNWLTHKRQTIEDLLPRARRDEPELTAEALERRLSAALAEGLVTNIRRAQIFWHLNDTYEGLKGAATLKVDDQQPYRFFLREEHVAVPTAMDRFGLFNMQVYHRPIEFYVGDLTVNGQFVDLRRDPNWKGLYNRATFVEHDFQREDFGYSESNWAGGDIGEIGGQFYRLEPVDPNAGYYADRIGTLTLDDPLEFTGKICFVNGTTDAGMFLGYFDAAETQTPISDPRRGSPLPNQMGIMIDGPTRVGYYFSSVVSPTLDSSSREQGPVFLPDAQPTTFRFHYDPAAGEAGQITLALGDEQFTQALTPEQRRIGSTFTHFGLAASRRGGKYVELYFDDLNYTARRPGSYQRVFHEEQIKRVPYPDRGRDN